jgi:hypothetical protein
MADTRSPLPSAPNAGPAPVPYNGPDASPEPPPYGPPVPSLNPPGVEVMNSVSGNAVQESSYAHDINAGLVTTYYPGSISPIHVHGDADAGGRDIASSTVAGAVAAREAFYLEYESDTHTTGAPLGDAMTLPGVPDNSTAAANGFLYPQGNQPGT